MKRAIGCGFSLIVVLGVGGLYGWFSYRPWAKVDAAEGRLQILRNRVPLQWRVAAGLTELDEVSMTPSADEWRGMRDDPVEAAVSDRPSVEEQASRAGSLSELAPPSSQGQALAQVQARLRQNEPILERLARARMVRATNDIEGGAIDDVVRWMAWRAWVSEDCLAASIDGVRAAQGHTLLSRAHTGTWWTESAVLRLLEPRIVECAHGRSPDRLREAADALLRIDDEREAFVVNIHDHIDAIGNTLTIARDEVRNVWVPHVHVDPVLDELEVRLSTAEALADTGSLLDVMLPRDHPQWEQLRVQRDREIALRIEYRLLAAALRLIAGDEPDVVHPLSEDPVENDESRVFWGYPAIDPEGHDEVVVWNPAAEPDESDGVHTTGTE